MGTRGSAAIRRKEAAAASRILKLAARDNLGLPDAHLQDGDRLRTAMVRSLRRYRPRMVLMPHWEDQHPDHAAVGQAGLYAAWLAGAPKYDPRSGTTVASKNSLPYRPRHVLHYNNRYGIKADIVIDISTVMSEKEKLVACFGTQFGPGAAGSKSGQQTRLSSDNFFEWLRGMHAFYGYQSGVRYGEPYASKSPLSVADLQALLR